MTHPVHAPDLRTPPLRRWPALIIIFGIVCVLTGCTTGPDTAAQDDIVPATTSAPSTVTRTPLLPPVPSTTTPAPATDTWATSAPPLQYDRLYSEEEQAQIRADLQNAAARAR